MVPREKNKKGKLLNWRGGKVFRHYDFRGGEETSFPPDGERRGSFKKGGKGTFKKKKKKKEESR